MAATPIPDKGSSSVSALELAREVLRIEADAITAMIPRLGPDFLKALELILGCSGRVVVSGIGKSGHVARKIASTMASTGTPACLVHPAEGRPGAIGLVCLL
jgi:arabinose-5-phosphate isomerase